MYASAFPVSCVQDQLSCWEGCESSQAFMETNGVKIAVLELEECKELIT